MSKYLEYFDGAFDSTVADKRKLENKPYVAYSKTDGVVYTIIPKEEKDMWIITAIRLKDISNCTYNMVDLGLPSGLKWADRNIGSTSPEHYGSYFQWGDTNAYTYDKSAEITTEQLVDILNPLLGPGITVDNVKDVLASQGVTGNDLRDAMKVYGTNAVLINKVFNWESYFDKDFNKYNNNGGLTTLESIDDAATVHMGGDWRMPTSVETSELVQNTDHYYIDWSGNIVDESNLDGSKLRSICFVKKDEDFNYNNRSNFIEFPFAGVCNGSLLEYDGLNGHVWSSSVSDVNVDDASCCYLDCIGNFNGDIHSSRYVGFSVRGVQA